MKSFLFVFALLFLAIPGAADLPLETNLLCYLFKDQPDKKIDPKSETFFRVQDSVKVVRDSLTQHISKHSSFDKKSQKIKFKGLNPQEFSRKNRLHGDTFYMFVGTYLLGPSSTMLPKSRIERDDFWIVPCSISWSEDGGVNDGETAVCVSKNAVWPCYKEWTEERKKGR